MTLGCDDLLSTRLRLRPIWVSTYFQLSSELASIQYYFSIVHTSMFLTENTSFSSYVPEEPDLQDPLYLQFAAVFENFKLEGASDTPEIEIKKEPEPDLRKVPKLAEDDEDEPPKVNLFSIILFCLSINIVSLLLIKCYFHLMDTLPCCQNSL